MKKLNILIPMAGAGSRFKKEGYTLPKFLIPVFDEPMIYWVIKNVVSTKIESRLLFITQKQFSEDNNLNKVLYDCPYSVGTPYEIIHTDGLTEGAACTVLLAKEQINNDNPLLIINCDQFVKWDKEEFYQYVNETDLDGAILTFKNPNLDPKWSYVKINENGNIIDVQEKKAISTDATVGAYYWKRGSDFVKYAVSMIEKNIRVNNEFYLAPVYNESIQDNRIIKPYNVDKMFGIGTPSDLEYFLNNYKRCSECCCGKCGND